MIQIGKLFFTLLNLVLAIIIGFWGFQYYQTTLNPVTFELETKSELLDKKPGVTKEQANTDRNKFRLITSRNIFDADLVKPDNAMPAQKKSPAKMEQTKLNLELWGTVIGDRSVFAVIEDKKLRKQDLYQVGDKIQDASIKAIRKDEVVLNFKGKDQILSAAKVSDKSKPTAAPEKQVKTEESLKAATRTFDTNQNQDGAKTNARFRTYQNNGKTAGFMIYGIRPRTTVHQMGIKNGDIIQELNGEAVTDMQSAIQYFSNIHESVNGDLTFLRRGKLFKLSYSLADGQYSVNTEALN